MGGIDIEALAGSQFKSDDSESNGSSIAFIAEYNGKRAILTGDAHPSVLSDSLKAIRSDNDDEKLNVDVLKVSHHGSKANLNTDIFEHIDCSCYLISTNGKRHKHPNPEAIARIIKFANKPTELIFNYRTKYTEIWDNRTWQQNYNYTVKFLDNVDGENVIAV